MRRLVGLLASMTSEMKYDVINELPKLRMAVGQSRPIGCGRETNGNGEEIGRRRQVDRRMLNIVSVDTSY